MDLELQTRIANHTRILQLLSRGNKRLHQIFLDRWQNYHELNKNICAWKNGIKCGKEISQLCPEIIGLEKKLLERGEVDTWDITLTKKAIETVSKEIQKFSGGKIEFKKEIEKLANVRNRIAHGGKAELTDSEYSNYWKELETTLVKMGDNHVDIEAFKESLLKLSQQDENGIKTKFASLKKDADNLIKNKKYEEAIKIYTEILKLPGILPEDQAVIFCDRSEAYLLLKADEHSLIMAKRDAKCAIKLWPSWWKGYFCLGKSKAAAGKWYDASKALENALVLNHGCKEVLDELSYIGIITREEHMNPAFQTKLHEEETKEHWKQLGVSDETATKIKEYIKTVPKYQYIIKGHDFRDGDGVPQDYTKAASYYAKAAHLGVPEGMYNLALLYEHGRGVPRNFDESFRWLVKASEGKARLMAGSGISEAQHMLGLKYTEGVGVEQNYKEAIEWYEKAVKNGFAGSANNLGTFYEKGYGVERDFEKAFYYYKLASQWGDTQAMQNLANFYFSAKGTGSLVPSEDDMAEGMKWLRISSEKGNLTAQRELERREKLTPDEIDYEIVHNSLFPKPPKETDPLDQELYGEAIKEAARKGSKMAQTLLEIWSFMNAAMEAFKKNDYKKVIENLSKAIFIDHQIAEPPELFIPCITKMIAENPEDIDAITCYVRINTKYSIMPMLLSTYVPLHPEDAYLMEMLISCQIVQMNNKELGLNLATDVIETNPNSLRFLYCRAVALCLQDEPKPGTIQALDTFLALAPEDHNKVPACHYRKAEYYISQKDYANFLKSYEEGQTAEKKQLPCFLPYNYSDKHVLDRCYLLYKKYEIQKIPLSLDNLKLDSDTKKSLNPLKKAYLIRHRSTFFEMHEKYYDKKYKSWTVENPPNASKPPSLVSLKKITLKDMDLTTEKVYDEFVLEAKIIDYPFLMKGIATIIEDENGDIQRIAIYNWFTKGSREENVKEAMKVFRPNTVISIINPYMRMAADFHSIIRIERPAFIRLDDSLSDQSCYICGKECKTMKCGKCLMTRYCSKDCQKIDWIEFNHKDVCQHLKTYSS